MKKKERNTIPNRNREAILEKKRKKLENQRPKFGLPLNSYSLPKFNENDEYKFINNHTFVNKALRRYLKGDYDFYYKRQFFIIPVKYDNTELIEEESENLVEENLENIVDIENVENE